MASTDLTAAFAGQVLGRAGGGIRLLCHRPQEQSYALGDSDLEVLEYELAAALDHAG
jgi:hypothetical protein